MKKSGIIILCLLLMVFGVWTTASAKTKVKVKRITIKSNYGKIVHVGKGKKIKVTSKVTTRPNRKSWKGVQYKSKNKRVATINSIGQVKGIKLGSTRVYAISKKNKKKRTSVMVKVVKPLKKIIFKTTEVTLKTGESFVIKKSVVPSDSGFKQVTWKSSVPTVANVSSTGKVTAKKPGLANITAQAVDGSGTKAVCKVKVESTDTINLVSVKALSKNTVRVSFDRDIPLELSAFSISGRASASGSYNKSYKLSRMRCKDNHTYDIRVEDGMSIERYSSVRVAVSGLPGNGVKSMEAEADFVKEKVPPKQYICGTVGEYIQPVAVDLSDFGTGAFLYQVGNLPEGITYRIVDNTILFTGKPTRTHFGKVTTLVANDEKEKEITSSIYWYIGSEDTMVGYADGLSLVTGEELTDGGDSGIHVIGGSGNYQYSFYGLPQGLQGDEDNGSLSGTIGVSGDFKVRIDIQDKENVENKITFSLNIHSEAGYVLHGVVKDDSGNAMKDVMVNFVTTDGSSRYMAKTAADGTYRIKVVQGVYDGMVSVNSGDAVQDEVYQYTADRDSQIDFKLSCWQVQISYDKKLYERQKKTWNSCADKNVLIEGDDVIYVRAGCYELFASAVEENPETGEKIECVLRVEFTVTNAWIQTEAKVEYPEVDKEEISHAE